MKIITPDLIFSDWIFAWYLLYAFRIVKISPKFALIIGLIENLIMLSLVVVYGRHTVTAFQFAGVIFLIKIIPLYYLRNERIKTVDLIYTGLIFILFNFWLYLRGQTFFSNALTIHDSLLYGKNKTPFMSLFSFYA